MTAITAAPPQLYRVGIQADETNTEQPVLAVVEHVVALVVDDAGAVTTVSISEVDGGTSEFGDAQRKFTYVDRERAISMGRRMLDEIVAQKSEQHRYAVTTTTSPKSEAILRAEHSPMCACRPRRPDDPDREIFEAATPRIAPMPNAKASRS